MTKYAFLLLSLCSLFLASSCDKAAELTQFEFDYTSNITIPSTFGINLPFDVTTPPVPTNSSTTLSAQNTAWSLVRELRMSEVKLTVTAPDGQTLDFLQSVRLFIDADGLDEVLIASKDNIPNGTGPVLQLDITPNVDLKPYLQKDNFQIRAAVVTDQTVNRNVDVAVYTKFFVRAGLL